MRVCMVCVLPGYVCGGQGTDLVVGPCLSSLLDADRVSLAHYSHKFPGASLTPLCISLEGPRD